MTNTPQNDQDLSALFHRVSSLAVEPPAFLSTRVLARVRERKAAKRSLRVWQWLSLSFASACVLMVLYIFPISHEAPLKAAVGKPHVVMVSLQDIQADIVANAEIVLPDGVYFHSETFPEIQEKRSIKLVWGAKPVVPFVLKGDAPGKRMVLVRFSDANQHLLLEKKIEILFQEVES